MKQLLARRVGIAWLLLVLIAVSALLLVWKVAVLDAPPMNAVLISSDEEEESIAIVTSPVALARRVEPTRTPEPPTQAPIEVAPTLTPVALPSTPTSVISEPTPTIEMLAVYVSGAVKSPGVYTLPVGARVADALAAAGGPLPEADVERLNLAARVVDEEHIAVLRKGETPPTIAADPPTTRPQRTPTSKPTAVSPPPTQRPEKATPPTRPAARAKVNINTAPVSELEALPGIGPVLAARIVAYREAKGPFATVDDLAKVPGIKDAVMSRIRDYITVGP